MLCDRFLVAVLLVLAFLGHDQQILAERLADDDAFGSDTVRIKDQGKRRGALTILQALITDGGLQPRPPGYAATNDNGEKGPSKPSSQGPSTTTPVPEIRYYIWDKELNDFWRAAGFAFVSWLVLCYSLAQWLFSEEVRPVVAEGGKQPETEPSGETNWRGGFPRPLEIKWLNESFDTLIAAGAKMMFWAAASFFMYRSIRFERRLGGCIPVNRFLAASELVTLAVVMVSSIVCIRRPSQLYWVLLLFFFFYVLACALPPFAFSCTDLVELCPASEEHYIEQARRHADCSLEGYTSQQTLMTWILVLPWSIPRSSLMPLAWLWLVMCYFSWTMLYRYYRKTAWKTFSWSTIAFHFVLLNLAFGVASAEKAFLERMQRMTFLADLRMKNASRKLFNILKYMVPVHVILPMIQRPGEVIAEQIDRVSILFVLIDDFDEVADQKTPAEVLAFLNEYFTKFDDICEAHKVTKIETVGEEYVACVGVMPEDVEENKREGHSKILSRLILAADKILKLQNEKVRFKMGVHTGPIVAGVIGLRLPRYRLFGDTINTAARLMQKGLVGQLQFGEETHKDLPSNVEDKLRGEVELKGKGPVKTYLCERVHHEPSTVPTLRPKRQSIFEPIFDQEKRDPAEDNTYTYQPPLVTAASATDEDHETVGHDIVVQMEDDAFEEILSATKDKAGAGLEGEEYLAWRRWHHETKICNKITPGLDMQMLVLLLLTAVEGVYMYHYHETEKSNSGIPAKMRLPLFLGCRGLVLVLICMWRWALSSGTDFIRENGSFVMWGRLITWSFVGVVLFISYDDLTPDDVAQVEEGEALVAIAPFSQNFSLVFVLVYTLLTRMEGMLFKPSLVFIFLAVGLMLNAQYWETENIVASIPAKFFFAVNALLASAICYTDEQTSRTQFKAKLAMESTTTRVQGILSTLMPPLVLEELRQLPRGAPQPTHVYKSATICQSDLCGFTQLSSTRTPREVVGFMGELFGKFDELTNVFGVYKVETVGDAYIAGTAEAPLTPKNQPVSVLLFGLAMIEAVHAWARNLGESVTCRVGVHYGECIGGVVGTGMQRYHLFGKLLCGMEILESTAPEGHVQISPACKAMVERQDAPEVKNLFFKQRDEPHLKTSKGLVHEYESVGGRTFVVAYSGDISSLM